METRSEQFQRVYGMLFPFDNEAYSTKEECDRVRNELRKLKIDNQKLILILIAKALNMIVFPDEKIVVLHKRIMEKLKIVCANFPTEEGLGPLPPFDSGVPLPTLPLYRSPSPDYDDLEQSY